MQTALTLLLCCVPVGLFGGLFAQKWRFRWFALALYILAYLPPSFRGHYEKVGYSESKLSGEMWWRTDWVPHGLAEASPQRDKAQLTYYGTLFWPLIVLDNLFWHQSIVTHASH